MPLLKTTKNKKDKGVFLGVNISKEDSSFLSLYCNSMGVFKTSIVKKLITDWVEKKNKTKFHNRLIRMSAIRIYEVWEEALPKQNTGRKKYKDFDGFCDVILDELISKGLSTKDAADVIGHVIEINNGKEKENSTEKA